MQDSLRDQLLQAGFEEQKQPTRPKKVTHKKRASKSSVALSKAKDIEQKKLQTQLKRKNIKAQIKVIIEKSMVKDHAGEKVYSYILGSRVKQLYLNPECHQKISAKILAITRLNGATILIPVEVAEEVLKLNADWAIVLANDNPPVDAIDELYSEFKVPDDLQW